MRVVYLGCWLALLFIAESSLAQTAAMFSQAIGSPADPKVRISWNRYHTSDGLHTLMEQLAKAHPNLVKLTSLGKSYLGKDIWLLTVTDFSTGDPDRKPGFYIDGNIHSNELQCSEVVLYTGWYLAEMFEENAFIRNLLAEKVFYLVPTINPDARDFFILEGNNANSPRAGMIPVDDDLDGLYDEDSYNDLDGDGSITMMRRKNPNGRYKTDPRDHRMMVLAEPDEPGEYELLGYEGIDNDGDGMVNEDRKGGFYDPNRDYAWNWQPGHIQPGGYKYPFSVPENQVIANFFLSRPNIAGAQNYHNSGGMLLRGPGAIENSDMYDTDDIRVYDQLGKYGENVIPGYKYLIIWKDLYTGFGGALDWYHGSRGIFTFANELYTPYMMFEKNYPLRGSEEAQADAYFFDKKLLFEDGFTLWKPYKHPQFGNIEIGGFKKSFGRNTPGFLLEAEAHRNMAFTLYHAYQTPKLVIREVTEQDLGNGLMAITAVVANERMVPTHAGIDLKLKLNRPNYVTLSGANVLAGMRVLNGDMGLTEEQRFEPWQIEVPNIPGMGSATVRWIVEKSAQYQITLDSAKGGVVTWQK